MHTVVAHVHAIDDGIPQRSAALDDFPAHGSDKVIPHERARIASGSNAYQSAEAGTHE